MSNSSLAVRELPETERTLAFGSIGAAFTALGTPLAFASLKLVIQNQTNTPASFSWDGINTAITLYPGCIFTSDIETNNGRSGALKAAAGTQFYVKYLSAPASGAVYLATFYGANFNNL